MQYLPYIQMAILILLTIACVYLLLVSRSNKRDLQEIRRQIEEIENNSSTDVKHDELKDSSDKSYNSCASVKKSVSKPNDLKHIIIEFCRNINSNKCFIVLEEMNDEYTKMIIPTGEIKDLENSLFKDFEELSLEELLVNDYITRMQIDSYFSYIGKPTERSSYNDHSKKINENNEHEPPYLKSYRAMLSNPDTWPSKMLETIKVECPITQKRLKEIMDSKYEYSPAEANGSFGASLRMLLVDGYIKIEGIGDSKIIIAQQNISPETFSAELQSFR